MAHEDSPDRDGNSRSDESNEDSAPITIATSDPDIDESAEHRSDWKVHPDSTLRVETTQVYEPSPLHVAGVRTIVVQDPSHDDGQRGDKASGRRRGGSHEQDRGNQRDRDDRGSDNDQSRARPRKEQQPSMMSSLMVTAGVALVAGLIGAFGYSYMQESKSNSSSSDQSQIKGGSGSKGGSSSKGSSDSKKSDHEKGSGGQEDKESGNDSSSQSPNASSDAHFASADDVSMLKNQMMDLIERVGGLTGRVDRVSRLKDEMPTLLQTLQIEMSESARKMGDLASLPTKIQDHDKRLGALQAEIALLRSQIDTLMSGKGRGLAADILVPGQDRPVPLPTTEAGSEGPTLELGIHLLEKGEYASARTIFDRLERTEPSDARVWYFGALAVGLVSGDWNDEAKELAEKGLERERAGAPPSARVDASLATHASIQGVSWLNSLRRQPQSVSRTP